MSFADHFSGVSAAYAAFRPRYPDALFEFLSQVAPARDDVWDAGHRDGCQREPDRARHARSANSVPGLPGGGL